MPETDGGDNVGAILQKTREAKRLDINEAAEIAKIPADVARAFEEMDSSALPPRVYARGFLHRYAAALGADTRVSADEFLDFLFPDTKKFRATPVADPMPYSLSRSRVLTIIGVVVAFLSIAVFFSYQFRFFVRSPGITLESPIKDAVVNGATTTPFEVRGTIDPSYHLTLNGAPLYSNEAGEFKQTIYLASGLNTLVFEAKNTLGKASRTIRHILVK